LPSLTVATEGEAAAPSHYRPSWGGDGRKLGNFAHFERQPFGHHRYFLYFLQLGTFFFARAAGCRGECRIGEDRDIF